MPWKVKIFSMLPYAVCEIGGKQYKISPNIPIEVDLQKGKGTEVRVLLLYKDGKLKIGKPYLKEKINVKYLENISGDKVRVSKYHAKANYRKVRGFRPRFTRVVLDV